MQVLRWPVLHTRQSEDLWSDGKVGRLPGVLVDKAAQRSCYNRDGRRHEDGEFGV